jgi:predicted nucleotidyltransferase
MSPHFSIDRAAVSAFCQRHHIARLALFGSVLRDDFRPDSDIDVLVEFQPGHVPGLKFMSIEREFSGLVKGWRVVCRRVISSTSGTCSTSRERQSATLQAYRGTRMTRTKAFASR